jgi:hypothetical protein
LKAPDAPVLLDDPVIRSIAEARRCTPAQVLIAWHLQRGVSTIPKSITPARLRENFAATQVELSTTDLGRVAGMDQGCRLIAGTFWAVEGGPWTLRTIWASRARRRGKATGKSVRDSRSVALVPFGHAGAAPGLRVLRPRSSPRIPRCPYLLVRVHLLCGVR